MEQNPAILEINDYQLQLFYQDQYYQSCGYAHIAGSAIHFGQAAQQQFRRHPLTSYNQYWQQLNLEPINTKHPTIRHFADFAHQQLLDLHHQAQFKQLIIAVPASFNRQQLALLLGISKQCPFEVLGLVDAALFNAIHGEIHGKTLHLDIQLHQSVITQLQPYDQQLNVSHTAIIPGAGISQLENSIAQYLGQQFILQCRFDPLHHANSEQALYDLIHPLITSDQPQLDISLQGHTISLDRQSISRACTGLFAEVLSVITDNLPFNNLILHSRVSAITELYQPLLQEFATQIIRTSEPLQLFEHIQTDQQQIQELLKKTNYINQYPIDPHPTPQSNNPATHILWQDTAYPLSPQNIYIGHNQISTQPNADTLLAINHQGQITLISSDTQQLKVNGQSVVTGHILCCGDTLIISESAHFPISAIRVLTDQEVV